MGTLIAAYAVAAAAVSFYAAWLVIGIRRLSRRLERLQPPAGGKPDCLPPAKKIA